MSVFLNFKKEFDSIKTIEQLEQLLNKYNSMLSKTAINNLNKCLLPIKKGNTKLGNDTLIFNTNSVFNCYCRHNDLCELKNSCYAYNYTNRYPNSFINSLISEINFNKLTSKDIIKQLDLKIYHSNTFIRFIRVNEQGDIKNNNELQKLEDIAYNMYNKYGIITYCYTHNKELDLSLCEYLVINTSNFTIPHKKSVLILEDFNKLESICNKPYYNICLGDCYNCSYCKDITNKNSTVFVNHSKLSIKDIFKKYVKKDTLKKVQLEVLTDNSKFLEDNF